jgi:hypothetical protein
MSADTSWFVSVGASGMMSRQRMLLPMLSHAQAPKGSGPVAVDGVPERRENEKKVSTPTAVVLPPLPRDVEAVRSRMEPVLPVLRQALAQVRQTRLETKGLEAEAVFPAAVPAGSGTADRPESAILLPVDPSRRDMTRTLETSTDLESPIQPGTMPPSPDLTEARPPVFEKAAPTMRIPGPMMTSTDLVGAPEGLEEVREDPPPMLVGMPPERVERSSDERTMNWTLRPEIPARESVSPDAAARTGDLSLAPGIEKPDVRRERPGVLPTPEPALKVVGETPARVPDRPAGNARAEDGLGFPRIAERPVVMREPALPGMAVEGPRNETVAEAPSRADALRYEPVRAEEGVPFRAERIPLEARRVEDETRAPVKPLRIQADPSPSEGVMSAPVDGRAVPPIPGLPTEPTASRERPSSIRPDIESSKQQVLPPPVVSAVPKETPTLALPPTRPAETAPSPETFPRTEPRTFPVSEPALEPREMTRVSVPTRFEPAAPLTPPPPSPKVPEPMELVQRETPPRTVPATVPAMEGPEVMRGSTPAVRPIVREAETMPPVAMIPLRTELPRGEFAPAPQAPRALLPSATTPVPPMVPSPGSEAPMPSPERDTRRDIRDFLREQTADEPVRVGSVESKTPPVAVPLSLAVEPERPLQASADAGDVAVTPKKSVDPLPPSPPIPLPVHTEKDQREEAARLARRDAVREVQQREILDEARGAAVVWTPQERPARTAGSVSGSMHSIVPANTSEREPADKLNPAPRALLLAPVREEAALPPAHVLREERIENIGETGRETVARRGTIGDNNDAKPMKVPDAGDLVVPRAQVDGEAVPRVYAPEPGPAPRREGVFLATEVRSRFIRVPVVNVLDLVL